MATLPEAAADQPEELATGEPDTAQQLYADDLPSNDEAGEALADGESEEGESQETSEPELEPIEAPKSLTAEEREEWNSLPRAAQEVLTRRIADTERQMRNKTWEMGEARVKAERQAREAIVSVQNAFAQEMESFLSQVMPPRPDPRLLQTGQEEHRTLFYRQEGEYQAALAQRQQAQQLAQAARLQASQVEEAQRNAELAEHEQILSRELGTEWTDPSARERLLSELQPIGADLGYPAELMAQANATDILALAKVRALKVKADKWDAAQKSKMEVVRKAKELPRVTQPGVAGGNRQAPQSTAAMLYPNDVRR